MRALVTEARFLVLWLRQAARGLAQIWRRCPHTWRAHDTGNGVHMACKKCGVRY